MYILLYCEYCNYKSIFREKKEIDIVEISDEKYRCPKCGRLIKLKKIKKDPQKELNDEKHKKENEEKIKKYYDSILKYREKFEELEEENE